MAYYLTRAEMAELREFHGGEELEAMFKDMNIQAYESVEAFQLRTDIQITTDNAPWTSNKPWSEKLLEFKPLKDRI